MARRLGRAVENMQERMIKQHLDWCRLYHDFLRFDKPFGVTNAPVWAKKDHGVKMHKKYLTVLRSTEVAQIKIIDQFGNKSDPKSTYFEPRTIEFTDATSLLPHFENWNKFDLMVPGKWNGTYSNHPKRQNQIQCTRHEKRDRATGEITQQAFIVERECPVIVLDLDNIKIPSRVVDPSEPLQVATAVWDDFQRDQAFLRGGDALWVASSSFGFPCSEGKAKLHLVLILKTPLLEHDLQALLQSFPEGTVDLSMSQVARKHYFAMSGTGDDNIPHPLAGKQRCGVFAGQPIDWSATPKPVKPLRPQREIVVASETSPEGRKVLERQCAKIKGSGEGQRHSVALSAAYTVGGYVGAGLIVADEALSSLLAAVDANPNEDDHEERHGTIETAFNDGMNDPIETTPEPDMATQFQGGTGGYRPAGAMDAPSADAGFVGMPGMMQIPATAPTMQERVVTTLAGSPEATAIGHQLAKKPKAERAVVMQHAREMNPVLAEQLQQDVKKHHAEFRAEKLQMFYEQEHRKILDQFVVITDAGERDGRAVIYQPATGAKCSFSAFHEKYENMGLISLGMSEGANGKPKEVFEKVTKHWINNNAPRYDALVYDPTQPQEWMDEHGRYCFNEYRPAHAKPAEAGDVSPYLYLVKVNYPAEQDRDAILGQLAFSHQRVGEILMWATVQQGTHGCGKGLIVYPLIYNAGIHNIAMPTPENLTDDKNGWLGKNTGVFVDEIGEHRKATIAQIADRLKVPIASDVLGVRAMQKDLAMTRNFACWFFATNHKDSMLTNDPRERRYAPLISALQTPEDVAAAFPASAWQNYPHVIQGAAQHPSYKADDWFSLYRFWYDHCGGNEAVRAFLMQYPPAKPGSAPETTTKGEAIAAAEDQFTKLIRDRIAENDIGFAGGFISVLALERACVDEGVKMKTGQYLGQALAALGYCFSFRTRNVMTYDAKFLQHPHVTEPVQNLARVYYCENSGVDEEWLPRSKGAAYMAAQEKAQAAFG